MNSPLTYPIFLLCLLALAFTPTKAQDVYWSKAFADAIMDRHYDINNLTGKGWEYSNSIVLIGIEKLYYETGRQEYLDYIKGYIDDYINNTGQIGFDKSANNLDHLHPGWLCITLWEETGEEKYKLAAQTIRAEFDNQPRNPSGGFWHKQKYPNQMWADGIYMAEPFLIRYGHVFNDMTYAANEATKQATLIADHAYDSTKNLMLHGWDETKNAGWANTVTGNSPEVWSRGMGWYVMALVDILDYLPESHPEYDRMVEIMQGLAAGIKDYQDEDSGLWYQVVDKGNLQDNWLETSGSAMYVYALKRSIDKGYIDSTTYMPVVNAGWAGLQDVITLDAFSRPVINNFVRGMGIKSSYNGYISEQIVDTPPSPYPHGYCGILMAATAMEFPLPAVFDLNYEVDGEGEITVIEELEHGYYEGTEVSLTAQADDGWTFTGWSGSISSTDNPLVIHMDSSLNLLAHFEMGTSAAEPEADKVKMELYPAIADESIRVEVQGTAEPWPWTVIDTNGRIVLKGQCSDTTCQLNISGLPSAQYFLRVKTKGNVLQRAFVVR